MVLKVHELEPDGGNPGTTHRSRPHHIAAMLINPPLCMINAHFYHLPLILSTYSRDVVHVSPFMFCSNVQIEVC